MSVVLLRLPEVRRRTGLSKASVYAKLANGTFPRPVRIGVRSVAWIEAEVAQWIDARIAASRSEVAS